MKRPQRCATPHTPTTSGSRCGTRPRLAQSRRHSRSALPADRISPPAQPPATPPSRTPARARRSCCRMASAAPRGSWGGSARLWRGMAMSSIAVDHPGNNGRDPMTIGGAVLFWERPGDLAAALDDGEKRPVARPPSRPRPARRRRGSRPAASRPSSRPAHVSIFDRLQQFLRRPSGRWRSARRRRSLSVLARRRRKQFLARARRARPPSPTPRTITAIPGRQSRLRDGPRLSSRASIRKASGACGSRSLILLGDADKVAPPATNGESRRGAHSRRQTDRACRRSAITTSWPNAQPAGDAVGSPSAPRTSPAPRRTRPAIDDALALVRRERSGPSRPLNCLRAGAAH